MLEFIVIGVLVVIGYAYFYLHMTLAQMKADLIAEINKLKGK